jgi:hypothetical protein
VRQCEEANIGKNNTAEICDFDVYLQKVNTPFHRFINIYILMCNCDIYSNMPLGFCRVGPWGMQGRRKLYFIGGGEGGAESEGFLDFGEDLTEFRWSENSVLICQNLQFSSTKWAKVYLINYIFWISYGKVWVIPSFFAVLHGLNAKGLHDFEKRMIISKFKLSV